MQSRATGCPMAGDGFSAKGIAAPLYWQQDNDGHWLSSFGLSGLRAADPAAPVTHISLYEADAYASWAGVRGCRPKRNGKCFIGNA